MKIKKKNQTGAAMYEMAIVLPLLIFVVMGCIQYGFMLSAYISVRNAASVAARYAAVENPTATASDITPIARDALDASLDPNRLTQIAINNNYSVGGSSDAHLVTLGYNFPVFAPFVVPNASGGNLMLQVNAIAR